jgi:hypothetical protein
MQRVPLPFDILPTAALRPVQHEAGGNTHDSIINNGAQNKDEIITSRAARGFDETPGMAILNYIYDQRGSVLNYKTLPGYRKYCQQLNNKKESRHKPTFYMPDQKQVSLSQNIEPDLIDKGHDGNYMASKGLIKFLNKEVLIANDMNICLLIDECNVSITDLRQGGVVESFEDLRDLGFVLTDLTRNRKLFNADQFVTFFQLNYRKLVKCPGIEFSVLDLIKCKFHANELYTLEFSFEHLIKHKGMNKEQLHSLNLSLADLRSLSFKKEHLTQLDISKDYATKTLKWSHQEYNEFKK